MLSVFSRNKRSSDVDLLTKYRDTGDLDVLGEVYGRYMDLVFGVCLKYLKHNDQAQDGVIHIFEKIALSLKATDVDNFKPWLYVVAKNYCLMELRKVKYHVVSIEDDSFNEGKVMETAFDMHPIDAVDEQKNEAALKACIDKLKAAQKQSIELFYFQELSYQQVSEQMEVEVKKVKSYIQNAKRNLKICLESNGK